MVNSVCDKCKTGKCQDDIECEDGYSKKEVIIVEADDSSYIHGECFETTFSDNEHNWNSTIGTQYRWKDKVKITIEQLEE